LAVMKRSEPLRAISARSRSYMNLVACSLSISCSRLRRPNQPPKLWLQLTLCFAKRDPAP
jgi:hypothetical protein